MSYERGTVTPQARYIGEPGYIEYVAYLNAFNRAEACPSWRLAHRAHLDRETKRAWQSYRAACAAKEEV